MDVDLVRRATDESVLTALLDAGQLTRAEIAGLAGISRPTASESVRRLTELGLVVEAGRQTGGRGRSGTYCQVAPGVAFGLAVHAGPGEVIVELLDATLGASPLVARLTEPIGLTTTAAALNSVVAELISTAQERAGDAVPARVISVAAPIDVRTREIVPIDPSPFVLDGGSLAEVVGTEGVIDNDVAWAALAELAARVGDGERTAFLQLYLGAGLGAALVDDGRPVQGARGLAGEIAQVLTVGPGGGAMTLFEALAAFGLTVPGTSALDVERVRGRLTDAEVVAAVAGVVMTCATLLDPGLVVLSGPWGADPALTAAVGTVVSQRMPHRVTLDGPRVTHEASLRGARAHALAMARARLLARV